ncbi:hypothetical protein MTO96_013789 [Rhipicephalus appendiculatus]
MAGRIATDTHPTIGHKHISGHIHNTTSSIRTGGPAYRNDMELGRGDKAKVDYVKGMKPVAYDTVIQEEKKVVIKEEPKLVLKEVPKVVVKEQPKVIIKEQPKVIVQEVPAVIVHEVPKKKHKKQKTHGHHGHDCFSDWFQGLHKKGKKPKKHHKSANTILLLRPHAPYYYYTQAPSSLDYACDGENTLFQICAHTGGVHWGR